MHITGLQKIKMVLKIAHVSFIESVRLIFGYIYFGKKWTNKDSDRPIQCWARRVLEILGVKYEVINIQQFEFNPSRPYILMSNHLSHCDIPLIYVSFLKESVRMISKKEIFRIPIFGWAMKMSGIIAINRENKRQAFQDLQVANQRMLEGIRIWIAPEGTRSRTGELGVFKKGGFKIAMDVKAIIVPVAIVGSDKILPAGTFDFSIGESVKIYIGKPIDTEGYGQSDIKKLMADTHTEIAGYLKNTGN